jgi:hypothetical protein
VAATPAPLADIDTLAQELALLAADVDLSRHSARVLHG